jgi:hypothetical protein
MSWREPGTSKVGRDSFQGDIRITGKFLCVIIIVFTQLLIIAYCVLLIAY